MAFKGAFSGGAFGKAPGSIWGNTSAGGTGAHHDEEDDAPPPNTGLWSAPPPQQVGIQPMNVSGPGPASGAAAGGMAASSMNNPALREKEQALARREQELLQRERQLQQTQGGPMEKKRNWPLFCPFFYHNISEECQPGKVAMVRLSYYCFLGFCVLDFWQWLCVTSMVLAFRGNGVASWFLASIYLLAGVPGAFILWYRRIYVLGKTGHGHIRALVFLAVHTGFCVYCAIAPPFRTSSGAVDGGAMTGYLSAASAFSKRTFLGIMYISGAIGWTCESVLAFGCLGMIYRDFRGVSKPQVPQV